MRKKKSKDPSHYLIVETSDWSKITQARKQGVSWDNLRTRNGLSALGMAIVEGSALATQTLLEMGAPIQSETLYNGDFFSPLWFALERNKPAILDVLLQAGSNPNERHPEYGLPLSYAAENHLLEETKILCKHGSTPNTETAPSPLWMWIKHTVPFYDTQEMEWIFPEDNPIQSLLKNGARIHVEEDGGAGLGEIELARRLWLKHPLKGQHHQNVLMTLSMMEKNLLTNLVAEHSYDQDQDDLGERPQRPRKEHKM